ncbi:MAG: RCC1 domain-containing protein [Planctomycetota bacterium]
MIVAAFAIVAVSCNASDTKTDETPKRDTLELAKHDVILVEETRFTDASGKEKLVKPGIYHVEKRGDKDLRLSAVGSDQVVLLRAETTPHKGKLVSPQARIVQPDNATEKLIVFWDPDGEARVAVGFAADVRMRSPQDSILDRQNIEEMTVDGERILDPRLAELSSLNITRPFYRSVWTVGRRHVIRWSGSGYQPSTVKITLCDEAGTTEIATIAENAKNALANLTETSSLLGDGSYSWYVSAIPGRYGIKISHSTGAVEDLGGPFTVVEAPEMRISAGYYHALAIRKSDRTAWGWGGSGFGALGQDLATNPLSPLNLGMADVCAVAAGKSFSLFLKTDGTVWACGDNRKGQLGAGGGPMARQDGIEDQQTEIKPIQKLSSIQAISAGPEHGLALTVDGEVKTWGGWSLTTEPNPDYYYPVSKVSGIGGTPVAISAGAHHSLALLPKGIVRAWGWNKWCQLGNGTETDSASPVTVSGLSNVTAIAAGSDISIALKADGTVWTWGGGYAGTTLLKESTPIQVQGLPPIKAIATRYKSLAIDKEGRAWTWGWKGTPVQVAGLRDIVAGSVGNGFFLALRSDGSLFAWGKNGGGQLGNGTTDFSATPVRVGDFR